MGCSDVSFFDGQNRFAEYIRAKRANLSKAYHFGCQRDVERWYFVYVTCILLHKLLAQLMLPAPLCSAGLGFFASPPFSFVAGEVHCLLCDHFFTIWLHKRHAPPRDAQLLRNYRENA
jgi:hypothetical protein